MLCVWVFIHQVLQERKCLEVRYIDKYKQTTTLTVKKFFIPSKENAGATHKEQVSK